MARIAEIKLPIGKTVEVEIPDDATDQEITEQIDLIGDQVMAQYDSDMTAQAQDIVGSSKPSLFDPNSDLAGYVSREGANRQAKIEEALKLPAPVQLLSDVVDAIPKPSDYILEGLSRVSNAGQSVLKNAADAANLPALLAEDENLIAGLFGVGPGEVPKREVEILEAIKNIPKDLYRTLFEGEDVSGAVLGQALLGDPGSETQQFLVDALLDPALDVAAPALLSRILKNAKVAKGASGALGDILKRAENQRLLPAADETLLLSEAPPFGTPERPFPAGPTSSPVPTPEQEAFRRQQLLSELINERMARKSKAEMLLSDLPSGYRGRAYGPEEVPEEVLTRTQIRDRLMAGERRNPSYTSPSRIASAEPSYPGSFKKVVGESGYSSRRLPQDTPPPKRSPISYPEDIGGFSPGRIPEDPNRIGSDLGFRGRVKFEEKASKKKSTARLIYEAFGLDDQMGSVGNLGKEASEKIRARKAQARADLRKQVSEYAQATGKKLDQALDEIVQDPTAYERVMAQAGKAQSTAEQKASGFKIPPNVTTKESVSARIRGKTPSLGEKTPSPTNAERALIKDRGISFVTSADARLRQYGQTGGRIADMYRKVQQIRHKNAGQAQRKLEELTANLTDAQLEGVTAGLDLGLRSPDPRVNKVVDSLRDLNSTIDKISAENIKDYKSEENFFPRFWEKGKAKEMLQDRKRIRQESMNLVKSGRFEDIKDAEDFVYSQMRKLATEKQFSSLDFARTANLDGWIRDPKISLARYYDLAYKRLAEIEVFGVNNSFLEPLFDELFQIGGQDAVDIANDSLQIVLETYRPLVSELKTVKALKDYQVVTKLGLAQLSNFGSLANNAAEFGLKETLASIREVIKDRVAAKALAKDAGALQSTVSEMLSGDSGFAKRFMKMTGFNKTDRVVRYVTAATAKRITEKAAAALIKSGSVSDKVGAEAAKKLKQVELDPETILNRGYITDDEVLTAVYNANRTVNFTNAKTELPVSVFWQDSSATLLTQFKAFSYQQSRFLKDRVFKPLVKEKNFKPLIGLLLGSAVFGEATYDTKAALRLENPITRGREFKNLGEFLLDAATVRQMENFMQIGQFGIFSEAVNAALNGSYAALGYLAGPLIGTASEGLAAAGSMDPAKIADFGLEQIPVAGNLYRGLKTTVRRADKNRKEQSNRPVKPPKIKIPKPPKIKLN